MKIGIPLRLVEFRSEVVPLSALAFYGGANVRAAEEKKC